MNTCSLVVSLLISLRDFCKHRGQIKYTRAVTYTVDKHALGYAEACLQSSIRGAK